MPVPVQDILDEFDRQRDLLRAFASHVEAIVRTILKENAVVVHRVDARHKGRNSLHDKLLRSRATYQRLYDVTDVVGVRIITFFQEDIDIIATLMARHFIIDYHNSIDKGASLDPDRFGYVSLHYVGSLADSADHTPEVRKFCGIPFEAQLRTLLQHTWAEIEHDLGYKATTSVPRPMRRRFSRLAGMLELADEEFAGIRKGLQTYERELEVKIPAAPQAVRIDQASLRAFVEAGRTVQELDGQIATKRRARLELSPGYLGKRAAELEALGLTSLRDVEDALQANKERIPVFANGWMRSESYEAFRRGIALYFLGLLLLAERGCPEELWEAFELDAAHAGRACKLFDSIK